VLNDENKKKNFKKGKNKANPSKSPKPGSSSQIYNP
jgi:hypothetical protein